jgi:phage repressor protein C with HTH and peptisase S24 domain
MSPDTKLRKQAQDIQEVMKQSGLSIEEIAARIILKPDTMRKYAKGYQLASDRTMQAIRDIPASPHDRRIREEGTAYGVPPIKLRYIPLISWAQAGTMAAYEELPKEWQSQVPTDVDDPRAFALTIRGESMEPYYKEGDLAILVPSFKPRDQDLVVAKLNNEDVMFKLLQIVGVPGEVDEPTFRLVSYNPLFRPLEVKEDDLQWMFTVDAVLKKTRR